MQILKHQYTIHLQVLHALHICEAQNPKQAKQHEADYECEIPKFVYHNIH